MKNVIFMGAGASKADGAPVQNEIFNKFFEMCECEKDLWSPKEGESFEVGTIEGGFAWNAYCHYRNEEDLVKSFLEIYFGDITSKVYPTFEEVLALIDISMQRKELFLVDKRFDLNKFRNIIIETIKKTIEYYQTKSEHNYCDKLVEKLLHLNKLNETIFVTTNYDLLLEKAIYHAGQEIDFGFEFTNNEKAVKLYKIHGSLNWFQCPICNKIYFEQCNCNKCKIRTSPIIIPPSFFKSYQNKYLSKIWELTEDAFSQADKIIFCGYSFPDADIYIKYLLKRGEFLGEKHTYYIVNNYDGKSKDDINKEIERYKRFLKDKTNIHYTSYSFEMFASDPTIIIE